jgi:tripartite ATP-independent periplasmic transporter solute receptor, DctP family
MLGKLAASIAIATTMLVTGTVAQDKLVLKLGHPSSTIYPTHIGALKFAEEVDRLSGGTMEVQVFPLSQLGSERDLIEGMQIGSVDMAIVPNLTISNFVPAAPLLDLPLFYKDADHLLRAVHSEPGQQVISMYEEQIGKVLAYYRVNPQSIYNKTRPINSLEDISGLKLRVVQSPTQIDLFGQLGAAPTALPLSEVYGALQQGIVEGAANDPETLLGMKHYEIAKYYSLTKHIYFLNYVFISNIRWNALSAEQQGWLAEAAQLSAEAEATYADESFEQRLEELRGLGVEVNELDREPLREVVSPMWEKWVPTEHHDLLKQILTIE